MTVPRVRVVVALLGALLAGAVAVGVLARRARAVVVVHVLVGRVEPAVARARVAVGVEGRGLVQARVGVRVVGVGRAVVGAIADRALSRARVGARDAVGRGRGRVAHGLDDDLALAVLGAARVLRRPHRRQLGAHHVVERGRLVVGAAAVAVAALGVVLRVHQAVVVVAVAAALVLRAQGGGVGGAGEWPRGGVVVVVCRVRREGGAEAGDVPGGCCCRAGTLRDGQSGARAGGVSAAVCVGVGPGGGGMGGLRAVWHWQSMCCRAEELAREEEARTEVAVRQGAGEVGQEQRGEHG